MFVSSCTPQPASDASGIDGNAASTSGRAPASRAASARNTRLTPPTTTQLPGTSIGRQPRYTWIAEIPTSSTAQPVMPSAPTMPAVFCAGVSTWPIGAA